MQHIYFILFLILTSINFEVQWNLINTQSVKNTKNPDNRKLIFTSLALKFVCNK